MGKKKRREEEKEKQNLGLWNRMWKRERVCGRKRERKRKREGEKPRILEREEEEWRVTGGEEKRWGRGFYHMEHRIKSFVPILFGNCLRGG